MDRLLVCSFCCWGLGGWGVCVGGFGVCFCFMFLFVLCFLLLFFCGVFFGGRFGYYFCYFSTSFLLKNPFFCFRFCLHYTLDLSIYLSKSFQFICRVLRRHLHIDISKLCILV